MVRFYLDVHIQMPVYDQLLLRGVDVVHAIREEANRLDDESLFLQAVTLSRVMVTADHRFRAMAEQWQAEGRDFPGLIFCPASLGIGVIVRRLEHIGRTEQDADWRNRVAWLLIA